MKSHNGFRGKTEGFDTEDALKRAAKLEPIKKNGKDRIALDAEDDDELLTDYRKKESILDYYDDDDPEDPDPEDQWDEEDWEDDEQYQEDEIEEKESDNFLY